MDNRTDVSLAQSYARQFTVGAAVTDRTIETQEGLLTRHFASVTPENQMKWEPVHPEESVWRFGPADAIVAFAMAHGMKVRGHTLVWHNQLAEWVFREPDGEPADSDVVEARLRDHIATLMGRYRGRVYAWDVVNEAVSDGDGDPVLRRSPWLEHLGSGYVARAFHLAHAADPDALLFYNDYNEWHPGKRARIASLLQDLRREGVPVHGLGLQGHWNLVHPTVGELRETLDTYAALGLRLHVTELDVSLYRNRDEPRLGPDERTTRLAEQARRYEELFQVFTAYAHVLDAVTFWGAADDHTWLSDFPVRGRQDWPLLFDAAHQPKAAFWRAGPS